MKVGGLSRKAFLVQWYIKFFINRQNLSPAIQKDDPNIPSWQGFVSHVQWPPTYESPQNDQYVEHVVEPLVYWQIGEEDGNGPFANHGDPIPKQGELVNGSHPLQAHGRDTYCTHNQQGMSLMSPPFVIRRRHLKDSGNQPYQLVKVSG